MGTERSHGAHRSTNLCAWAGPITAKASRWCWMDVRVECRNMQWALRYMYALGRVGSGRGHGMERAGLIALLRTVHWQVRCAVDRARSMRECRADADPHGECAH